jgi:hypothetical protein
MTAQTRMLVFLESFLGNFLFSICMLYGVSMTSAVSAGVIMAAIPAVVAVLSWLFLGESVSGAHGPLWVVQRPASLCWRWRNPSTELAERTTRPPRPGWGTCWSLAPSCAKQPTR